MIDVLQMTAEGALDEEGAQEHYERAMERMPQTIAEQLGLSHREWTAFCHGAPFALLAAWRYGGWPTVCAICSRALNASVPGWFVKELAPNAYGLVHIGCLPEGRDGRGA